MRLEYHSVAKFFIEDTDRFGWFKERELDSYREMFPTYKKMLLNFREVEDRKLELTFDEILALFKIKG